MKSRWIILPGFLLVAVLGLTWLGWHSARKRENRFDPLILSVSRRYQVDPALIKAVIWRESRFNPSAAGRAGELGLMQIREAAASEWATAEKVSPFDFRHLLDPQTNTMAGTWYLARLLRRYERTDNPIPFALADYNAGRRNVLRWNTGDTVTNASTFLETITFPGTRSYVQAVTRRRDRYRSQFPAPSAP